MIIDLCVSVSHVFARDGMPLISHGFSIRLRRKHSGTYRECLEALQGFAVEPRDSTIKAATRYAMRVWKAMCSRVDFAAKPPPCAKTPWMTVLLDVLHQK